MAKRASKETANGKLAELKAKHFTPEGREERIAIDSVHKCDLTETS